ncbi:hypothetical protein SLEP1_g55646 [Rubroshorea leprosula]|uniref:Uncharacterized protein n=1 Tax=Rubroshorea leprosula TaxID=152421 RepID=A0AAV5MH49_9ROSI|nr:hypothetical protein SLEP1_g55646 [Rubroshorea leprosula]
MSVVNFDSLQSKPNFDLILLCPSCPLFYSLHKLPFLDKHKGGTDLQSSSLPHSILTVICCSVSSWIYS